MGGFTGGNWRDNVEEQEGMRGRIGVGRRSAKGRSCAGRWSTGPGECEDGKGLKWL